MKTIWKALLPVFVLGLLCAPAQTALAAEEDVTAKNEAAMVDSADAVDAFWQFSEERSEDTSEQFYVDYDRMLQETADKLGAAASAISTEGASAETAAALEELKTAILSTQAAFKNIREATADNDSRAADQAYITLDDAIDAYNLAYDKYSKSEYGFTDSQYKLLYWAVAGAAVLVTLASILWAFVRNNADRAKTKMAKTLRDQRKVIARDSLWPLGGALITLGTYYFPIGDTYFIAWGAVLFGLVFFVRSLMTYKALLTKPSGR